jgi:phospholipase D1/2
VRFGTSLRASVLHDGNQRFAVPGSEVFAWLEAHRYAWYALPLVMLAFIALGWVPATVLVTATGVAFGPVLGPLYGMAGCLGAASVAFGLGRRLGRGRIEKIGGGRVLSLARRLKQNGVLSVFIIRKIPAPYALINMAVGASPIRYRDFLVGTFLGVLGMVVGLAGFGSQALDIWRDPTPGTVAIVALFVTVPLVIAWLINRKFKTELAD